MTTREAELAGCGDMPHGFEQHVTGLRELVPRPRWAVRHGGPGQDRAGRPRRLRGHRPPPPASAFRRNKQMLLDRCATVMRLWKMLHLSGRTCAPLRSAVAKSCTFGPNAVAAAGP